MNTEEKPVEYVPGGGRTGFAITMMGMTIAVNIAAVATRVMQVNLLNTVLDGGSISLDTAERSDMIYRGVILLWIIVSVITAIAFLMWFYRARKNLQYFDVPGPLYSPVWAVIGFFIPVFNLIRPYQVAKEIWKSSGRLEDTNVNNAGGDDEPVSVIVKLWWGAFIISGTAAWIAKLHSSIGDDLVQNLLNKTGWIIAGEIFTVIGALLAITMIIKIDARQSRRHAQILSQQI